MRIRRAVLRAPDRVELPMTPMIDIVFQLLAFFIMTLKVISLEGDFDIKMPPKAESGPASENALLPMRVRLTSDDSGDLTGILFEGQPMGSFAELNQFVHSLVGDPSGPNASAEAVEVEIDADYRLHYRHTVAAVTAVSGYLDERGNVIKLIDKIKFVPPMRP
jgi:biopolymer transport protein ExbD